MMRSAYMDVGQGREQDAEASFLSTSYEFFELHVVIEMLRLDQSTD